MYTHVYVCTAGLGIKVTFVCVCTVKICVMKHSLSVVHNTQKAAQCDACCILSDKAFTIICHQEVYSMELLMLVVKGVAWILTGFCLILVLTVYTTGDVHSIWLDAND